MKPWKILLMWLLLLPVLWLGWNVVRPYFGYNSNELVVTVEAPLTQEKLSIETGFFPISRASDREIFSAKKNVVFEGKELKQITNDYGENDFLIKYADSIYIQFRHFKTNNKQRDTYRFKIYSKDNKIFLKAKIEGTDPMEFEREFTLQQTLP